MAHNNGRIYIDPNTTGVEIADLQQVLGRATGDQGQLCSDQEVAIPYQMVEYLESTGTQYIDTEIIGSGTDIAVEMKFQIINNRGGFDTLVGAHRSTSAYYVVLAVNTSTRAYIQVGDGSSYITSKSASPTTQTICTTRLSDGSISIESNGVVSSKSTSGNIPSLSLYMFARNQNGTPGNFTEAKVFYAKIWNDGVLVRDFYPVRVGDVGYMYDMVSGELFGNSGTGAFVLGEDVAPILRPVNRINKWAKYRPIEKANFRGILTDAQRSAENWGLGNIPIWTNKTIPQMVKFWIGGSGSTGSTPPDCGIQSSYWTKVLPSTYYRLRDFAADVNNKGYFHGAQAPISPLVGELAIPSTGQLDVIYPRGAESAETILLSDIGNFDDYYFGVIFANADFSLIYIMTQEYAMGSASWTQDFTLHIPGASSILVPSGTSATWRVFPIFCNASFTTLTDVHSNSSQFTTVALLDYTEEVVTKDGVNYNLVSNFARRDNGSKVVSYSFQFINNETGTGLTDVRIAIEYKTSLGEVVTTAINDIGSVQASASVSVTGSHQFNTIGIAESIYSVVAHVERIVGRDYTTQWAEAVVNEITPD